MRQTTVPGRYSVRAAFCSTSGWVLRAVADKPSLFLPVRLGELVPDPWTQVLAFVYTLAHTLGQLLVGLIQPIVAPGQIPQRLVDPIGFLAVLTIFLAVSEVARKLAWIVVLVGWVLIIARVVMLVWSTRSP